MKSISLNEGTKADFLLAVKGDKPTLFLCFANWCGHCISFKPDWEKIKKTLATNKDVSVVEVEYDNMKYLPKGLQNIRGFPTIQIVKKGKVVTEFQGNRDHDTVVRFALDQVVKPKENTLKNKKVKSI